MANLPPNHNEFAPAAEAAPDNMNGWVEEEDPEMEEEEEDPKFTNKVHELRAVPCHMFRTSEVQIPEDDLEDLSLTREEEDGTSVALDPHK
ncbi:hypothetical protein Tco_0926271 [Tanacetum coccineum]|uniref:Uncharacterized protein n=1 Tax=Tanacetum coccineum TaxID=301880 RepID=A0ABQ5DBV4_9ASTR